MWRRIAVKGQTDPEQTLGFVFQIVVIGNMYFTQYFQEALGSEVMKQIAGALLETVQCPVCLIALRPPVTLCSNGHGLCSTCKPSIQACPTCRQGFVDTVPIILHQLLDALPRDCQYKSLGCTEVCIPGGNHEQMCGYRTIECKVLECDWSGEARKLKDHVLTNETHGTVVIAEDGLNSTDVIWEGFKTDQDNQVYIPLVAGDQVFWTYIYLSIDVKKLCLSFTHVPLKVSSFKNFMIVSFKNGNYEFTHTIDTPSDTPHFDFLEDHCMMIPQAMAPKFTNENSELVFSVKLMRENVQ